MIGVIPQALTSDLDLTVEENMNIYAKLYDVPAKERKKSIDELLELVDLTKWRDARPKRSLAACGAGWRSRAVWCTIRKYFFSMNRRPAWIRFRAWRFGKCWATSSSTGS
jgi:hypothetical protein